MALLLVVDDGVAIVGCCSLVDVRRRCRYHSVVVCFCMMAAPLSFVVFLFMYDGITIRLCRSLVWFDVARWRRHSSLSFVRHSCTMASPVVVHLSPFEFGCCYGS
ncbi:hypothetical protein MPSEU_001093000 [Mayamaea pseudoterrestris]|nr:hypothetical protein MPSEU_001093000 [Mayamaea pseudoterrestris]